MKNLGTWTFVGLVSLALSAGCSSNSSSGTGGSSGSKGGSNGSGGAGKGGTGGGGGTGVDAAVLGCPASDPPASADIATFAAADGGLEIMGGIVTYGDVPAPTYRPMSGHVEVTDNIVVSSKNHYQGFVIYFNGNTDGTDCINASSYTGIQFDLSGTLVGALCTVQFSINDSEHADSTVPKSGTSDASFVPQDPKASGPKGAYAPQLQIGPMITTTTTTIQVPFMGSAAPTGGLPADTAIDTTRIEGVQWQLTTPLLGDGSATECDLTMEIANVKFYK